MLFLLTACGGPSDLAKPHPPPTWPVENLHVKTKPAPGSPPPPAVEPVDGREGPTDTPSEATP